MTDPKDLLHLFALNEYTLKKQLEGLTHADSLKQLPFPGNCLNWVVGHIVEARNYTLDLLGEPRVWSEAKCQIYATRSQAISGPESEHYGWDEIVAAAVESLARIRAKLGQLSVEDLEVGRGETLGSQVVRMAWHEAYHIGQTEILRQLAGKEDRVL
jgi:hypothetical protein